MGSIEPEKAHAELGASKSERWMECPGSIVLERPIPEEPDSPYAIEGTTAHGLLEEMLQAPPKERIFIRRRHEMKHPLDMVEHVVDTAKIIDGMRKEAVGNAEFFCEQRVDSSPFTREGQFGTLDAAIVSLFDRLTVIDFKYGAGYAVNPEGKDGKGNPQLAYYALAVAYQYDFAFSDVELVVIQPRAYHESGQTIRRFTMSMKELKAWDKRFKTAAMDVATCEEEFAQTDKVHPDWINDGPWCKFCRAALICPKFNAPGKKAGVVISPFGKLVTPEVEAGNELAIMLDATDRLELWIEKVRSKAFAILMGGGKVGGYKLVKKKAVRKWTPKAEEILAEYGYEDQLYEQKMLTPAAFEKTFGNKKNGQWLMEMVTVKKSSGLTLVKEEDKRTAERRGAEAIFGVKPKVPKKKGN